ncbi:hypothetical protein CR105_12650 [Massilia eurypsychrophila]|jgi:hypothetical protein|uniref:Uncharacterized protein n=1 Tax=Massilia eurypsychrophila TaxID=1485217 RepID=A0A2G8TFC8_9BURK|nr:hypothetical protein [Massilia eurypsychrophila]PIL44755.1 hypothetical protein CR105_12650 [Massilia eurypsychrophila]
MNLRTHSRPFAFAMLAMLFSLASHRAARLQLRRPPAGLSGAPARVRRLTFGNPIRRLGLLAGAH